MNAANTLRADVPSCSTRPHLTLTDEPRTSCPLRFFSCRTFWISEIGQPSSAVEFGVSGRDLTFAADLEDVDTLDLLHVVASAVDGDPAPSNFIAAAEDIQGLEIERGLGGGAGDESRDAREGN
jgi:hypothetical protein